MGEALTCSGVQVELHEMLASQVVGGVLRGAVGGGATAVVLTTLLAVGVTGQLGAHLCVCVCVILNAHKCALMRVTL